MALRIYFLLTLWSLFRRGSACAAIRVSISALLLLFGLLSFGCAFSRSVATGIPSLECACAFDLLAGLICFVQTFCRGWNFIVDSRDVGSKKAVVSVVGVGLLVSLEGRRLCVTVNNLSEDCLQALWCVCLLKPGQYLLQWLLANQFVRWLRCLHARDWSRVSCLLVAASIGVPVNVRCAIALVKSCNWTPAQKAPEKQKLPLSGEELVNFL